MPPPPNVSNPSLQVSYTQTYIYIHTYIPFVIHRRVCMHVYFLCYDHVPKLLEIKKKSRMVRAGNFGRKLLVTISDTPYKYVY